MENNLVVNNNMDNMKQLRKDYYVNVTRFSNIRTFLNQPLKTLD